MKHATIQTKREKTVFQLKQFQEYLKKQEIDLPHLQTDKNMMALDIKIAESELYLCIDFNTKRIYYISEEDAVIGYDD